MQNRLAWWLIAWLVSAGPLRAAAQVAVPQPAPRDAPAPAAPVPASGPEPAPLVQPEAPPPVPPPSYQTECVPACRSGFVCMQGQCVSACNPPCSAGESCSADAMCIAAPSSAPAAPIAVPPPPSPDPTVERHDGFILHMMIGFGSQSVGAKASGGTLDALGQPAGRARFSGFAMHLSIDIGGSPIDNLALAFRLQFADTVQPNTTIDGSRYTPDKNSSVFASLVGPSITYYFMPINVYVTGAFGWASLMLDTDDNTNRSTGSAFGFTFDVGKEFWVGRQWGLGAALRFNYANIDHQEQGVPVDYEMFGWGILFSATYQ